MSTFIDYCDIIIIEWRTIMKVMYKGNEIELQDTNSKEQDIFPIDINLEDTIEFNKDNLETKIDISKIELEKTIQLLL